LLGRALLPLRAFLGFTFCFAGLQKLANPGFFQASNPGSIHYEVPGFLGGCDFWETSTRWKRPRRH
jgi:uncharacterized membrane protein YphA (DoxX/SURF4 family)